MFKKGQVMAFLIVGFVLILISGLIFFYTSSLQKTKTEIQQKEEVTVPLELSTISDSFVSCIKKTSLDNIDFVFMQGGYISPKNYVPINLISTTNLLNNLNTLLTSNSKEELNLDARFKVAIWSNAKGDISPSKKDLENNLAENIRSKLIMCRYSLPINVESNLTGPLDVKVNISDLGISIKADYPIEIKKGSISYVFEPTEFTIVSDINQLFTFSKSLNSDMIKRNGLINLNSVKKSNYRVNFADYGNVTIYTVSSNRTTLQFGSGV